MYDIKNNTITVGEITYHVNREPDRGSPEETLTVTVYSMDSDEFEPAFPGLVATLGMEEVIEDYMSPRDWSNVGTMAVSYRGYRLGDEDISDTNFEIECDACEGSGTIDREGPVTERDHLFGLHTVDYACEKCDGAGEIEVNPAEYFMKNEDARVVIGLFVYEHSGITMSAGARVGEVLKQSDVQSTDRFVGDSAGWDTSFVGFIYDTPEKVKECIGDNATDEQIEAALRQEVEVYASYLEGDVSFYRVEDEETDYDDGCGGYVGDSKHCEQECFASLECAIEKRLTEIKERADMAARDIITKG
jgi:hypothetical protein